MAKKKLRKCNCFPTTIADKILERINDQKFFWESTEYLKDICYDFKESPLFTKEEQKVFNDATDFTSPNYPKWNPPKKMEFGRMMHQFPQEAYDYFQKKVKPILTKRKCPKMVKVNPNHEIYL